MPLKSRSVGVAQNTHSIISSWWKIPLTAPLPPPSLYPHPLPCDFSFFPRKERRISFSPPCDFGFGQWQVSRCDVTNGLSVFARLGFCAIAMRRARLVSALDPRTGWHVWSHIAHGSSDQWASRHPARLKPADAGAK